jgi:hypothetical protein
VWAQYKVEQGGIKLKGEWRVSISNNHIPAARDNELVATDRSDHPAGDFAWLAMTVMGMGQYSKAKGSFLASGHFYPQSDRLHSKGPFSIVVTFSLTKI